MMLKITVEDGQFRFLPLSEPAEEPAQLMALATIVRDALRPLSLVVLVLALALISLIGR